MDYSSFCDPLIAKQSHSLFSFTPAPGATPDARGIYGVLKVRGSFDGESESDRMADRLLGVFPRDSILTVMTGHPVLLSAELPDHAVMRKVVIPGSRAEKLEDRDSVRLRDALSEANSARDGGVHVAESLNKVEEEEMAELARRTEALRAAGNSEDLKGDLASAVAALADLKSRYDQISVRCANLLRDAREACPEALEDDAAALVKLQRERCTRVGLAFDDAEFRGALNNVNARRE